MRDSISWGNEESVSNHCSEELNIGKLGKSGKPGKPGKSEKSGKFALI